MPYLYLFPISNNLKYTFMGLVKDFEHNLHHSSSILCIIYIISIYQYIPYVCSLVRDQTNSMIYMNPAFYVAYMLMKGQYAFTQKFPRDVLFSQGRHFIITSSRRLFQENVARPTGQVVFYKEHSNYF